MATVPETEPMSYIGLCRDCGGFVMATVDSPHHRRETARDVGEAIRDGLIVERVTCAYVRANWKSCKCGEPEATQLTLAEAGQEVAP